MTRKRKRKQGRPAKPMPRRIDAPPEKIAEAMFAADARFKKQEKTRT